jgi:hypothetical protein
MPNAEKLSQRQHSTSVTTTIDLKLSVTGEPSARQCPQRAFFLSQPSSPHPHAPFLPLLCSTKCMGGHSALIIYSAIDATKRRLQFLGTSRRVLSIGPRNSRTIRKRAFVYRRLLRLKAVIPPTPQHSTPLPSP